MEVAFKRQQLKIIIFTLVLVELSIQAVEYKFIEFLMINSIKCFCQNNIKIKTTIEKIKISQNKSIVAFQHLLNEFENGSYASNINVTFLVKVQNLFLQHSVNVRNSKGKYEPFLGKGVTDICKFLSQGKGNKFIRGVFDKANVEHLPTSCPVEPGFYFANNNHEFDETKMLSQYVGEVKSMLSLDFGTKINGKMNYFLKLKAYLEAKKVLDEKNNKTGDGIKPTFEKLELTQNSSILDVNYFLNVTEDDYLILSFNVTFFVKLQNLFLQSSINFQNSKGKYEPFVGKGVTDLCKSLNFRKGNKLVRMLFERINDDSKFITSCPVKPGFYYVNNMLFDGQNLITKHIGQTKIMFALDFGSKTNGKMKYFLNLRIYNDFSDRLKWDEERRKHETLKKKN
ncbi:CLUMA_CG001208, isoform A [Clunio marinus]|uniref:CLUMA_CG001208, isoform A n=1 Tax=Clunio marinus TaxID=568069 RepID=A0A1J1HLR7_9DIPT|nr:CLUMA_CG001208, isoform A [Clunio marinus]